MNIFIVHRTRGGKPMMMTEKSYNNGKALMMREGWRLATEEEIKTHYPEMVEVKEKPKPRKKAKPKAAEEE